MKFQIKIMFTVFLVFVLFTSSVYAVSTVLMSPADNFIDNDGVLDLRAKCTPTTFDGTTSYNITNSILYSNVGGTWEAEQIQQVTNPTANITYYFNFTNVLNKTAEGEFKWNVECNEQNETGTEINSESAEDRIIKVQYAKPTITTTSPADGYSDMDGYEIDVVCTSTPASGWNITSISLITDLSGSWVINQTNTLAKPTQDTEVVSGFTINKFGNNSIADGTSILFSCSSTQIKNNLEEGPTSEKSSTNRTLNIDYSLQQCVDGTCDLDGKRWCKDKVWTGGTESQYCSHCSYADNRCPVCEDETCDKDNRKWCSGGNWSVINYCDNCGDVDSYCAGTCENGICDSKNKKWCNNEVWDESNYCIQCGDADPNCFFECLNGMCDIKNKKWCNQGSWEQTDYYSNCNNKDFYYGASCQTSICDVVYNRWCDSGSWKSLNYCDNCEDSDCLGTCFNNACDVNAKKWCNNGIWANTDYCDNCGTRDSSCSVACQENICDTTANEYCFNGAWNDTDYCNNCALKDSDCTITCAEGECDTTNKRVCINGEWNTTTEEVYCSFCSSKDATCGIECLATIDGCCLNISDNICDIDCAINLDQDCYNCTSAQEDCCFPKNDTICDLDCAAGLDYDCTDIGCKDSGACKIGNDCEINLQCASGFCFDDKCMEQCNDKIKDGNETDVDCGGSCNNCGNYKKCKLDSDCLSDFCSSGTCLEKDTCNDGILDGDETDVDCGGSCPNKCIAGQDCGDDSDCERGFECNFNLCEEKIIEKVPADEKDSDEDGISDKWEIKHGLDLLDPSDAEMDFDEDGLTNLQEYIFGTDPNNADTDGDKVSDKKEIEVGTDPLDPISKPGGIGGLLFFVTILIIVLGVGGYGAFYYIHYRKELGVSEPSFAATYIPRKPYAPQRQVPRKDFKKLRIEEVVKKRREEKKQLREKIFGAFDKVVESKQKSKTKEMVKNKLQTSTRKGKTNIKKIQKPDVFSRLEKIYKKEEKQRKRS